ncbi:Phage-related minor tail protein [Desulfonatronum thiosulfatophilum]|uniref:Phage-related minor tail protein n=1 Tax=Desulfonatronum thiosulfatophilum TaxID=617002 RepID=A0A1G6A6Y5_9BACT|nr:phage tail length tape measure family protein [Desulfonatronum thiosulfatophilum]SDB04040.1 Phage-related minor tail protein [Desulfonatronum thiosulfatophilum]
MSQNRVQITITADGREARQALAGVRGELSGLEQTGEQTGSRMRNLSVSVGETVKSVAKLGAVAAAAAVGGLYALNRVRERAVELADIQDVAENKLQAVLTATGHSAGFTHGELVALAGTYQRLTTVGDEVIINGMAILGTFKNIRGEGFERATMAALDMSRAMGQDLNSSIQQIGRALNDPVSSLGALSRAGVQFTEEQREMIKVLWESGDAAGAQAVILEELEGQFGGAAAAARNTYSGMREAAANAYGDMWEQLGFVITRNQFFIDLMGLAEKQFISWGGKIEDNRDMLMELAKSGVLSVVDALDLVLRTVGFVHTSWLNLRLATQTFVAVTVEGLHQLFGMLRTLLVPFEALMEIPVRLGRMDYNPLTSALEAVNRELLVQRTLYDGAAQEIADAVFAAEQRYDSWGRKIRDVRGEIAAIPVEQAKATEKQVIDLGLLEDAVDAVAEARKKEAEKAKALAKEIEKSEQDKKRLLEKFSQDYTKLFTDRYEFERRGIIAQAKAYELAGADAVKVARWRDAELKKINTQETAERKKAAEEQIRVHAEAQRRMIMSSDQFFAGFRVGLRDLLKEQHTWGQAGYDVFRRFSSDSSRVVSDTLFNGIRGDMDGLGRSWDTFWKSMLRTMTDAVAKMATQWAASKLVDFGANMLDGMLSFHTGTVEIKQDELLAKLQKGEMVIPRQQAEAIRAAVGSGGMSRDTFFGEVQGRVEGLSRGARAADFMGVRDPNISGMVMGRMQSSVLGGLAAAAKNYASTMSMANQLQSVGLNIDMSAARSMARDVAVQGAVSSIATGMTAGLFGDIASYSLGVEEYQPYSKVAVSALAALTGFSGLGLGIMAGALSPMVSMAISGIADLLGVRANETYRDALEDQYGEIAGRGMYASIDRMSKSYGISNFVKEITEEGPRGRLAMGLVERAQAIATNPDTQLRNHVSHMAKTYGKSFTDAVKAQGSLAVSAALAADVLASPSFYSYATRGWAAQVGSQYGSDGPGGADFGGYSPGGPDAHGGRSQGLGTSGGWGNSPHGNPGGFGGGGPSSGTSGGRDSGGRGVAGGGGSSIGRRIGGDVLPGHMYRINEAGDEMFMPSQGGRILTAEQTREMLDTLKTISAGRVDESLGRALYVIAKHIRRTERIMDRWDQDGLPGVRV